MDFIGYVRVKVDRSKPLSQVPEVYLDRFEVVDDNGVRVNPPATLGRLFLHPGGKFLFVGALASVPVHECLTPAQA